MKKIFKICVVIERKLIKLLNFFNVKYYMKKYIRHLSKCGVIFNGIPNYIDPSAYFDGKDYSKIIIGDKCVISKGVTLLTHDLSVQRIFFVLNYEKNHLCGNLGEIIIGDNSFIGLNAILLPNTKIGKNCIIGAGSVVKGNIPDNSIVIGNPGKVVKNSIDWGKNKYKNKDYIYWE